MSQKMPERGAPAADVLAELRRMAGDDADWKSGRTFSLVYYAGDELLELAKRAYTTFFSENALSPAAFPSLRAMEGDVLAISAELLGGSGEVVGAMTSGGSESLMLAVKTARDAKRVKSGRRDVTMVLPNTAHPALMKAAHYLDVEAIVVPAAADFRADVAAMARAVDERTALLVGSAPAYPHGVVDPIEDLARVARDAGVALHVDACLGGFLLPHLPRLGLAVPAFDFRVPGVTSISADIHKYGFAAKGASVVLYRDDALRRHQYFAYPDWPGGLYGSAGVLGTRAGGAIAAAWAVLHHLGADGYLQIARRTMDTTRRLLTGIRALPSMRILGEPAMSVFAFTSDAMDPYQLGQGLQRRGWHIDMQQLPPSLHAMLTPAHEPIVEPFLEDLGAVLRAGADPDGASGLAAFYGMAAALGERGLVRDQILEVMSSLHPPRP
jgi:sphinganine-1-phosphate aldolase